MWRRLGGDFFDDESNTSTPRPAPVTQDVARGLEEAQTEGSLVGRRFVVLNGDDARCTRSVPPCAEAPKAPAQTLDQRCWQYLEQRHPGLGELRKDLRARWEGKEIADEQT